ncbi:phage integrase SAM-like domain-containing protein [Clostridium perfringens]|uniref:phage integrase SAM-like domain-containing protein n=1 Tax=Clostridium perfringens TaxID=1502 RepID=UPI0032DBDB0D
MKTKLIFDNGSHKCSTTINGKQKKVKIASFSDMSIIEASRVNENVSNLLEAKYTFSQIIRLLETAEKFPKLTRYSSKEIQIVIKLLYQNELQNYLDDKKNKKDIAPKSLVILNIGCTSSGKTLGNLFAIIPHIYVNKFLSLSTIKESTNFSISYVVNSDDKNIKDKEEYELEIKIKTDEEIKEDIKILILEAIQEILDVIKTEVKTNSNNNDVWNDALKAACRRLKVNKNKTFEITNIVKLENEISILEKIFIDGIRKYSTNSNSYNEKLPDIKIKEHILNDIRNNIFKLEIEDIFHIISEINEYKELIKEIYYQLKIIINKFEEKYSVRLDQNQTIKIKKRFDDEDTKELISNTFGNKKQRKNEEFFSIDVLIVDARMFFKNTNINGGNQLILVDGLGINQGQLNKGNEKVIAYNRVHSAIQSCNPDIIIYNTRLDSKDDYIIDVIKDLSEQGYKNRTYIVYGRVDTTLDNYCEEENIELNELTKEELYEFENYIDNEYINKESISLGNFEKKKIYLCDKPCKLLKNKNKDIFRKFAAYTVLESIIATHKENEKNEIKKLNKEKINKIIEIMNNSSIFNNTYNEFKNSINVIVPMQYNLLRWNTLECLIRSLYKDQEGFSNIYPSITLKQCFSKFLNNDELKEFLKDEYNDILKELLNQWIDIAHTLMITSYKREFSNLLNMRFDYSLRRMTSMTLTDERKQVLRNILYTSFKNDILDVPNLFKKITEEVLFNIIY